MGLAVAKSDEQTAPDRRARVRGSPGETLSCTRMTFGACKILRGCNVLQVPIQIVPLGVPKRGSHSLRGGSKIVMARFRIIIRNESQTVGNSPLLRCSPTLNLLNPTLKYNVCKHNIN